VPTHEEVDRIECGVMEQDEETADTRRTTPPTQQQEQKQDIQSEGEERGRGDEVLEAVVWIAAGEPTHTGAEARTEAQPTRPKRPENLKVERRGSPTCNRSRSRARHLFSSLEEAATPRYPSITMADIYKIATLTSMVCRRGWE
jgi:hypothetical protein